jgi:ATP/maltotriose-dependent transcriptional regulator MalT
MREALIAKGKEKVRKGRYFTLFAPRQTGKTTYFQLLLEAVKEEGFTPIWISFEKLKTVTRNRFYQDLNNQLHQELAEHQIKLEHTIADQIDVVQLFEKIRSHTQSVVLVIDEFEGIPDAVLSEMMHAFRQMYHRKKYHARNELILVGVRKLLRDK